MLARLEREVVCVASSFVCPRAPLLGERWGYTQGWTDRSPPINWAELEHEAGPPRNCAAALTHTPEENRGGGGHARTRTTRRSERTAEDTRPDKRAQHTVVLEYTRHVYHAISAHMNGSSFIGTSSAMRTQQTWQIAHTCSGQAPAMPPRGYTLLH